MSRRLSRRTFVQSLAASGIALPLVSSGRVWAAAAGKVNVASVGVGGRGWADLKEITTSPNVNVVAICDVDESEPHLGRAAMTFPQAKRYTDWRKLLEQKDIEAVHVATPDHMHAPVVLAALELGKPVCCQKPLTHTVLEARKIAEATKKAGVVTQMGNQIQSHEFYRLATKLVHDGVIGRVKEVHSWQTGVPKWRVAVDRPAGSDPVPETLHWNDWLGVAPERPYKTGMYHSFNWRAWQDYSNGQLGDFGCHILDPVFTSLALTAPTAVHAKAPPMNKETWPLWATVHYEFPATQYTVERGIPVTWYDGEGQSFLPSRDKLAFVPADEKLPGAGSLIIGELGSLLVPHVAPPKLFPVEKYADYKLPELEKRNHFVSWIDAIRGEDKATSHFGYSGPLTETVLLGTIAIRLPEQALAWNAAGCQFTNSQAANEMLTKPYRKW
jgi:predicted dehydrogenase